MSNQVVAVGDKFHIITRRLFDGDIRRHFVGEVTCVSGDLCEVKGYVFVFNPGTNEYQRRPEFRTRVFSFGNAGFVVNKIPREVNLAALEYRIVGERLVVTDGSDFALDVNEFGSAA